MNVMKEEAALVTLVKPQFEARRSQVLPPSFRLSLRAPLSPDASIIPKYVLYFGRWEVVVL